jgi:hypothetical protein
MSTQILLKILSLRHWLRQRHRCTRRRLEEHQARSLHSLREYAYARPPLYGWFHKGVADRSLNDLPILPKVIQGPEGLTVLLSGVREGFADATLIESLRRELKAQGTIVPPVEVRRVLAILRTTVGKAPLIKANAIHHAEKEH